jgi:hypothetical protein
MAMWAIFLKIAYTVIPFLQGHAFCKEKVASLEGNNLVVFYYLCAS